MRIVVDLQPCQSGSRLGGIGRYSMNLAEAMIRQCGEHELIFVLSDLFPETIPPIVETLTKTLPKKQIRVFSVPGPIQASDPKNRFRAKAAQLLYEQFVADLKPDIFHVSSLIEGLGDDVVTSVGAIFPAAKTSVTLYDLIPLVEHEKYLGDQITKEHYMGKIDELKKAGSLLAISEFSAQEAIEVLNIDPAIITTISSAVDTKFKPLSFSHSEVADVFKRHGITRKFLLFTGSFDQRKNHERLIRAFAALALSVRQKHQLLIIGNGWEGIYTRLRSVAHDVGLSPEDILFAGHVSDHDLLIIYNTATLFVFPSLSEGFGLPVLEAMSCGIPTIGSNTTSIPEVIGYREALFDPYSVQAISTAIHRALTDEPFRARLREHALIHSQNFSWDASARKSIQAFERQYEQTKNTPTTANRDQTIHAICDIARNLSHTDTDLIQIAAALEANETAASTIDLPSKIGWVTTWNTRCGIAMYSKYLSGDHLSEYTIFAPHEKPDTFIDEPNVIRCWKPDNDDFRELAEAIVRENITTVVVQFNYGLFGFPEFQLFIQEMVAQGRSIIVTLHATTDNPQKQLAQISRGLQLCDAVVVHTHRDIENLRAIGVSENVILFPQGIVDTPPQELTISLPAHSFIIASYGFFLPHKGFLELIDVVKSLLDRGLNIHLMMINAQYPASISAELIAQAYEKVRAYGIEKQVTIVSDFLSDETSLGYLSKANLILYPYQETGESSSAAVRMGLASGTPVAVTPLKIFDDVRELVMTLPSTSVEDMARGIADISQKMAKSDQSFSEQAQRAQAWRDSHRYSKLSESFFDILKSSGV